MTPPEVWEPLHAEFHFELDAAADEQTTRLPRYLTDSLEIDWPAQRIWLNPPYGRKLEPFVRKAAAEAAKGKLVVALIPFRCRAAWWHECVLGKASEVRCIRKRVDFLRPNGERGDFTGSCDSCIVVWDLFASGGSFNFEPGDGSIDINPPRHPVQTKMVGWEQAA